MKNAQLKSEKSGDAGTIYIHDTIGPEWMGMVSSKGVARELQSLGSIKEVKVHINSNGGDAYQGIGIYNLLKDHPARVVTVVDGIAASAAGLLMMAADWITMPKNASWMIHEPQMAMRGTVNELRQMADVLDNLNDQVADIYADRTGISKDEILAMMAAETWLTGQKAMEMGIINQVTENKAVTTKMDLSMFTNVPGDLLRQLEEAEQDDWQENLKNKREMLEKIA